MSALTGDEVARDAEPVRERIVDADFSNARIHGADFEGAVITDAFFLNADISGDLKGLKLNGVEVAPLVVAELDRRFPERSNLRAADPAALADAWQWIEDTWRATTERALSLGDEGLLFERVNEEWSFAETLRHLVSAEDFWLRRMILGQPPPYHPWGVTGSWLRNPESLGIDPAASPSLDEILALRRERMDETGALIAGLSQAELERMCVPPDAPGHPQTPHTVLECLHVVLDEEWEHSRYANRDLGLMEQRAH